MIRLMIVITVAMLAAPALAVQGTGVQIGGTPANTDSSNAVFVGPSTSFPNIRSTFGAVISPNHKPDLGSPAASSIMPADVQAKLDRSREIGGGGAYRTTYTCSPQVNVGTVTSTGIGHTEVIGSAGNLTVLAGGSCPDWLRAKLDAQTAATTTVK